MEENVSFWAFWLAPWLKYRVAATQSKTVAPSLQNTNEDEKSAWHFWSRLLDQDRKIRSQNHQGGPETLKCDRRPSRIRQAHEHCNAFAFAWPEWAKTSQIYRLIMPGFWPESQPEWVARLRQYRLKRYSTRNETRWTIWASQNARESVRERHLRHEASNIKRA